VYISEQRELNKRVEIGQLTCSESRTLLALMLLMAGKATEPTLPMPMAAKAHPLVGASARATSLIRLAHSPAEQGFCTSD